MQPSSQTWRSLSPSSTSPSGRVLIVDDEENVAVLLQHILARLGPDLELWVAKSGAQALDLLNGKQFDLLITDYQMPHMNGLELTKTVRRRCPEVKVILMTAYSSEQVVELADRLAIDCYMTKPFSSRDLWKMVCELLLSPVSLSPPTGGDGHDNTENRNTCR